MWKWGNKDVKGCSSRGTEGMPKPQQPCPQPRIITGNISHGSPFVGPSAYFEHIGILKSPKANGQNGRLIQLPWCIRNGDIGWCTVGSSLQVHITLFLGRGGLSPGGGTAACVCVIVSSQSSSVCEAVGGGRQQRRGLPSLAHSRKYKHTQTHLPTRSTVSYSPCSDISQAPYKHVNNTHRNFSRVLIYYIRLFASCALLRRDTVVVVARVGGLLDENFEKYPSF